MDPLIQEKLKSSPASNQSLQNNPDALVTRQFCFKTLETLVKLLQIMFDGGGF